MRIFHRLVFQGYVNGGFTTWSDALVAADMGSVDVISVSGYATQVSGTSPTLTIIYNGTYDGCVLTAQAIIVNALPLSTTQETLFQAVGPDPGTAFGFPYIGLNIQMGGTNPRGFFRVWVTGRDRSRRSQSLMQQVTDTADLAPSQAT